MDDFPYDNSDEEMFDALFESITDCGFIIDSKGMILDVNENALQKLGYAESDLVGQNILDFTPAGPASEAYEEMWNLCEQAKTTSFESILFNKDRQKVVVEVNCHFTGVDRLGFVIVSYRDIATRKEIEAVIENRDNKFKAVIEADRDGFLMLNTRGKILEVNAAYIKLSGYTREELLSMNYFDLLIRKNYDADKNSILDNVPSLLNNFHKTKSGDIIPVRANIRHWKQKNNVDVIFVFIHSIREYLQFTALIQKDRQTMKHLVSALTNQDNSGIIVFKPGAGIQYANEFLCNTFGYLKNEIMHNYFFKDFIHPDDLDVSIENYTKVFLGSLSADSAKRRFVRKDGSVFTANIMVTRHQDDADDYLIVFKFENIVDEGQKISRNGNQHFESILSKIAKPENCGILIGRPGAGLFYVNEKWCSIFGFSQNEIGKIKPMDYMHPDQIEEYLDNTGKVFSGFESEYFIEKGKFIHKDGSTFQADFTASRQVSDMGESVLVLKFEPVREAVRA